MTDNTPSKNNEVTVMVDSSGNELQFEKASEGKISFGKKFKEVNLGTTSLIGGSLVDAGVFFKTNSMAFEQILEAYPNGLYTATVSPEKLSHFKVDNTFTTMVRDSENHLISHAGFSEINMPNSISPAMVLGIGMQVMAFASSTYYLDEINSQISAIDEKLDVLFNMHEDEIIGKIISASKGLLEIAKRKMVDQADIGQIRHLKIEITSIYEQFQQRLKRYEQELQQKNNQKTEDKLISDINYAIKYAFETDKLSLYADLIEISVRIKLGNSNELIKARTEELKEKFADSFYLNYETKLQEIYDVIVQQKNEELAHKTNRLEGSEKFLESFSEKSSNLPFLKKDKNEDKAKKKGLKLPGQVEKLSGSVGQFSKNIGEASSKGLKSVVTGLPKREVTKVEERLADINQELLTTTEALSRNRDIDEMINEVISLPNQDQALLYIVTEDNEQRLFIPERV